MRFFQLQFFDFHAGRNAAVLERHKAIIATLSSIGDQNKSNEGKVIVDGFRTSTSVISSFQLAIYARAELEGRLEGLAFADRVLGALKISQPEWFRPMLGSPQKSAVSPILEAKAAVGRMPSAIAL